MHMIAVAIIALLLSTPAVGADVVATWKLKDGAISRLSIRDDQHVRIDTNERDTYMLLTHQKVYMVRKEDGRWTAFDMDQLFLGMPKGFGMGAKSSDAENYRLQFKDTGRHETIAGYKGKVFEITHTDPEGKSHRDEIVLSNHPDIEKVQRGWIVFATRMGQMLGQDSAQKLDQSLKSAMQEGRGGMLRYGKDMTLQRVEKPVLDLAHYQLPPDVQMVDMTGMGRMAGGQTAPPAGSEEAAGAQPAQKAEEGFVTDTADKAGDAAKDQTQQSIVEGVREGVKGLFKKVW